MSQNRLDACKLPPVSSSYVTPGTLGSHICAILPRFICILGIRTQAIMVVRQAPYLSSHLSYLGILFLSAYEYAIKPLRHECMGHIKKCI